MKILIVDDQEEGRALLEALLKGNGFKTAIAENGKVALQKLQVEPFDLIISDILMPVMDGFQLCRNIRKDDELKHIPFVFYTATYTDQRDEELALKVGADRFILKPAEPEAFIKILREVIEAAESGEIDPKGRPIEDDREIYKLYDERLVKKLEKKMLELQKEVADRKKAKQDLKESEERFRLSFDNANIGMCLVDLEGRLIRVNPKMSAIFGYDKEELENMTVIDITHPEDADISPTFIKQAASGEVAHTEFEKRYFHKQGHIVWGKVSSSIVRDAQGAPIYFISHVQDISEQKAAEQALRQSRRKYKDIFDNIIDIFYRTDNEGKILIVSPSLKEVFGYSPEEVTGKELSSFYVCSRQREEFLAQLREKGQVKGYETEMKGKDGSVVWVSTDAVYYRDENGNIKGVQGISRDITEAKKDAENRKKLEAQLQQAHKMEAIGTLAGGIAHDFNNILSVIIGYAEFAHEKIEADTEVKADIKEVLIAAERAKNLVKQILAFSRQAKEEQQPVQISLIAKEVLKFLRVSIPTTIDIRENIIGKSLVMSDPTQIHQILMNLCTNAAHAMQEKGGILEVALSDVKIDSGFASTHPELQPGAYLELTVSDTGHGMTSEVMSRIFDPFFTTKEKDQGTGLGLSVVHGIVRDCGGTITVYSEPDKGTTFNLYFPIIESELEEKPEEYTIIPTGTEHVLFVDDETSIIDITRKILTSLGYVVEVRTSSLEALELFKAMPDKFDLVITDMTMPQMTGDMLARELMRIRPDLPVILCTGFSAKITKEKAKTMGIKAFLMKPLLKNDMAHTIRRVLDS